MEKFLKYKINPIIDENQFKGTFVLEPLEKGFGQTIGNALRRICLTCIPGVSMFAIKIPSVTHEFSAIDGVEEDVTRIILNLKKLVIKYVGDLEQGIQEQEEQKIENWPTLDIDFSGPGVVTANDIICPPQFEIINKDLRILSVTSKMNFKLKIYAKIGRGFKSFSDNKELSNILSIIPTDSCFSPVLNFNYTIEEVKTSKLSTSDKLVIDVATNGSMAPSDVICFASNVLSMHLEPLVNLNEQIKTLELEKQLELEEEKKLFIPIEDLDFSVRAYNALKNEGIHTTQDLTEKTKEEITKIKNLGRKSIQEIINTVHERGLKLKDE